ncbi:hypothetical protein T10_1416 [Trichinella papuae]|uniref:Uncharacterized protein n=1 Tax=Trichinella papuae TaxID=268474 RepID=A0A0V1N555_9BILA|nr:hypothetical protein T10_4127 [Trichinella papuae]KRZ78862.1 hypothetical protein T10_1416 [Trichinella papuae]
MASKVGALPILINRIVTQVFRDISRNKQLATVWINLHINSSTKLSIWTNSCRSVAATDIQVCYSPGIENSTTSGDNYQSQRQQYHLVRATYWANRVERSATGRNR